VQQRADGKVFGDHQYLEAETKILSHNETDPTKTTARGPGGNEKGRGGLITFKQTQTCAPLRRRGCLRPDKGEISLPETHLSGDIKAKRVQTKLKKATRESEGWLLRRGEFLSTLTPYTAAMSRKITGKKRELQY